MFLLLLRAGPGPRRGRQPGLFARELGGGVSPTVLLPHLWPWVAALLGPGSHRGCPWLSSAWAPALALFLASLGGPPTTSPGLCAAGAASRWHGWAPPGAPLGPGHRHQGQTRAVSSGPGPVPVLHLSVPAARGHGPSSHLPPGSVSSRGHGWTLTGASAHSSFQSRLLASQAWFRKLPWARGCPECHLKRPQPRLATWASGQGRRYRLGAAWTPGRHRR